MTQELSGGFRLRGRDERRPLLHRNLHREFAARMGELVRYRSLIYNLVLRELKTRYKNSVLGFFWSLLNPLGMMLVFTVVFQFLNPRSDIEKYPIFLLCGLLPWNFFSMSVLGSISSVSGNAHLVKKVYFPREALPIASVLAQLVNFLLAFVVLFAVLLVFRTNFSPWLPVLPYLILVQTCFALGIAFFLSTLNVFYRDTMMVMDVVMLAWFFLSPVFYSYDILITADAAPQMTTVLGFSFDLSRVAYILNPMASIINLYRDLLYYGYRTDFDFLLRTTLTALVVLLAGYWFFTRYSGRFGEEV